MKTSPQLMGGKYILHQNDLYVNARCGNEFSRRITPGDGDYPAPYGDSGNLHLFASDTMENTSWARTLLAREEPKNGKNAKLPKVGFDVIFHLPKYAND
jgi:hypothetical protein